MIRFIKILTFYFIAIILFNQCSYKDDRYKIGQIWQYDTRPGEESSRLTVVAVEKNSEFGVIVSVYVDSLKIPLYENTLHFISHMPFSKNAMNKSVLKLVGHSTDLPDFEDSYLVWKQTLHEGNGKVFKEPVKNMINIIQEDLNNELRPKNRTNSIKY